MAEHYCEKGLGSRAYCDAKHYDATRVGWQRKPVEFLLNKLNVVSTITDSDPLVILELGAGTGKFTKVMAEVLKDSPVKIIASDPKDKMCEAFRNNLPDIEIHQFPAQKIDLPGQSVNFVVAANALHWFAESHSFDEIHRILVPGGMLGILWFCPDFKGCPWIAEIGHYLEPLFHREGKVPLGPDFVPHYVSKVNQSKRFHKVDGNERMFTMDLEADVNSAYASFTSASVLLTAEEKTKLEFKQFFYQELIDQYFTSKGKKLTHIPYVGSVFWYTKMEQQP